MCRLPRTYIVDRDLDAEALQKKAEEVTENTYRGVGKNCVHAVAKTLIAGGLTELNEYKNWANIATPGKYSTIPY